MVKAPYPSRTGPQPDVLVAENLWKSYGSRHALQGLTFSLKAGRILGLLGPYGAGKTTSVRILTTMMEPEAGQFQVAGISYKQPDQIRRKIGILPEHNGFLLHLTGLEFVTYYGQLYGFSERASKQKSMTLMEEVGLDRKSKALIGSYPHQMRQRLGMACALINDPVVIFLDEPTLGLNPQDQRNLLELIRQIARNRKTAVVLCTHSLTEVRLICDEVVILSHGQIVDRGPLGEILARLQRDLSMTNTMRVQVPSAAMLETQQILEGMPNILKVTGMNEIEGWLEMELIAANGNSLNAYQANKMLSALIRAKIPIMSFGPKSGRPHDLFASLSLDPIK